MLSVRKRFSICAALIIVALLCANVLAQDSREQPALRSPQPGKLTLMVFDKQGQPVEDVRQDELEVFEDGVRQTITSFTKRPLSFGLLVDTSGSLRSQLREVLTAARAVLNHSREDDEAFLVRFVDAEKIEFVHKPTVDKAPLLDALNGFYIEGGNSAIIDAVYYSVIKSEEYRKKDDTDRRRALVLITDGEDQGSFYKREQLLDLLRKSNVQVFVIGFVNELDTSAGHNRSSRQTEATKLLTQIAKNSGGQEFFPASTQDLPQIAAHIMRRLHTQYVLTYTPSPNENNSFRRIKVEVLDAPGGQKRHAVTQVGYMPR